MKPNFALNLSHEGISLLHRAKTGWLRVGDVALDAPDLDTQLNMLRRTAANLETGGLTSKLVIPNSQILYTEIDAPGPDTAARISQIRDGLVGLTPYDVNDLVFDWQMKGKRAHVAVVARDTLREAETFATEYRFNPVSFVAVPVNGAFEGEPYFGPTRHASSLLVDGEAIEPDKERINILGGIPTAPDPEVSPEAAKPKPQVPEPKVAATPKTDPDKAPDTPEPNTADKPDPLAKPAEKADTEPDPDIAVPAVTFSSRRKQVASPAARPGGMRSEPRITLATQQDMAAQPDTPPGPSPSSAAVTARSLDVGPASRSNGAARHTRAFDHPGDTRTGAGPALYSRPKPAVPPNPKSKKPAAAQPTDPKPPVAARGPDKTPMPVTAPHTADAADPGSKSAERRRIAKQKAKDAGSAVIGTIGKLARSMPEASKRRVKPATAAGATAAAAEANAMTVFGARGRSQQRGKPKYLGLALTLLLLLAMAILALWSTYFVDDAGSGLFGPSDDGSRISTPAVIPQPDPIELAPSTPETAALPEPVDSEPPQTPIEAAIETALAENEPVVSQPALDPADSAPDPAPDPQPEDLALLTQPEQVPEPPVTEALPEPDPQPVPAEPVVPDPIVSAPERQPPPSPAEAEARYAATGIWQLDPEPLGDVPGGGDQLDDLYIASIDPIIDAPDAVALPNSGALDTDQRPPALSAPTPLGTTFEFDDRGLVRATPDGALTPEGVPVFTGAPPVSPGPRPADLNVPVDETRLLLDERLRTLRPPLRPGGLAESNERARLGGFSSIELAAIRPKARPLSLQQNRETVFDTEQEETQTAAVDPVFIGDDATALAVAASRAPPVRPSNFATVVEQALREATRAPPAPLPEDDDEPEILASASVAAPRMPPVPSRASVAKQATVRNAISLSKVNLIGVYGSPSKRRALVRLSSGKYVKVEVGDRVDGGRVSAIGNDELRYVKRGKNITLKMPKG